MFYRWAGCYENEYAVRTTRKLCGILGSHGSDCDAYCLLKCQYFYVGRALSILSISVMLIHYIMTQILVDCSEFKKVISHPNDKIEKVKLFMSPNYYLSYIIWW
jgi:hypothetical protein